MASEKQVGLRFKNGIRSPSQSGRPRNNREDRAIRRVATSAPTTSLASIQRHLPPSRHPVPSRETIRKERLTEEPTSAKTLTTDPTS
ncbi:hypothetical protein TNCV_1176031 [Trichonephila clavipes]|nr:hypothetical protein TNCV_1176031 [Trichonephila clavipes]